MRLKNILLAVAVPIVVGATVYDLQTQPLKVSQNIGAALTAGDLTFVDMQRASQTNSLSGAMTLAHATNGTDLVEWTHRRYLFNSSGSDRLVTLPAGWHNASGQTFTVTNGTMAQLNVTSWGDTSTSARQTNVMSAVTFLP